MGLLRCKIKKKVLLSGNIAAVLVTSGEWIREKSSRLHVQGLLLQQQSIQYEKV